MKILAVHSAQIPDPNLQSMVDHWRIYRPMRELAKHVDWQIDSATGIIPKFPENKDLPEFTEPEMMEGLAAIKDYDIIFSSYHPDPTTYTLLKLANQKYGVQHVMDADDDLFSVNPDNPYWINQTHEQMYWMQRMVADNPWIVTPSKILAERFRERRKDHPAGSVFHIPNYISDDYKHPGFDNLGQIVIGYMGSATHYVDLHDTGVLEAMQKLMHEHKNVRFRSVGMILDKYLPKARTTTDLGKRGTAYLTDVFPSLNFDIAIAPLAQNIFNEGKSDIKYQEYARASSPVVASNVGPYKDLKNGVQALLVENTEEAWYKALKQLIDSPKLRNILVENAQKDIANRRIEQHWEQYKQLFLRVNQGRMTNANHRTGPGLFAGQTK